MGMSNYLENKLVDHSLGTTAYTMPTATYLALFTDSPGDDNSGTEVTGNGYTRKAVTFNAAVDGEAANDIDVEFGTPTPSDWGTVTHFGLFDAETDGNLLYHGALTSPKVTANTDPFTVPTGALVFTGD